ncbi:YheC/YheD family protein [Alcaligenes phenolicus]|uniref:acylphosphatase n=1 Tax=Alcaligenes phenolicus TaxID=232846 RepID=A0AAW5VUK6_9BURK|nr:YheC/YheD family protein [Alcaligenes phenolicus]MCX5566771.1 YheC/YheD family protein [Alcaligenes phenolicus]
MSLTTLLNQCKPLLAQKLASEPVSDLPEGVPACVLFFSVCNGQERAHVQIAQGPGFEQAWEQGSQALNAWMTEQDKPALWLRVDLVNRVEAYSWADQQERMSLSKRNYFRFGLSFKADFSVAFLEQELAANAILYDGKLGEATPNAVNLAHYSRLRFGQALDWPQNPEETVWRFKTMAVFSDGQDLHEIEDQGRHSGYRKVLDWGPGRVRHTIDASTQYLAEQVKQTGQYHYGWFPCFDRAIPTYNALRHASSTYALLEGWEVTGLDNQKQAIERALQYLTQSLIKVMTLPDGSTAAFLVDTGDEIKLGGNAVCLLALVKYTELTGDQQYLPLLEQLALGIVFMQDPEAGSFVHVLNYPDLSLKDEHRIIYYDGEAAFGLMRLYGLTRDARWLSTVEKAFDFFIKAEHWNAHDHWLSYCVNELTLYKPEPRYYQFGLDNVHGYLDFVQNRITTFPTLLELMMAAQRMIVRMQSDANPQIQAMLDGFPLETFYQALEIRARSLLDGFFWPELAMYFKNPARIVNGFFIRHHSFRVRIDDIEHYLSGYVAYLKYLQTSTPSTPDGQEPPSSEPVSATQTSSQALSKPLLKPVSDQAVIGLLSYPKSPRRFMEVKALAQAAWAKGLAVFYLSYQDFEEQGGHVKGYLFDGQRWEQGYAALPLVIDNAPANTGAQRQILESLKDRTRLLCRRLGGKAVTLDILQKDRQTAGLMIEAANLSVEDLRRMLDAYGSVVLKPYRSNRGKQVYRLSKLDAGVYQLGSDTDSQVLSSKELEGFCRGKSAQAWMIQRYISSRSKEQKPFDVRVPVFRVASGQWAVARKYARVGVGALTSNLATGGSSYEAVDFLTDIYGSKTAKSLEKKLAKAALDIAQVLQKHYGFEIDALGCDFGIQDGKLFLFEVNSYPGLKGCLDSAVALKTDFYAHALSQAQAAAPKKPILIQAASPENQALLRRVMSGGENDYSSSRYLRKGIANPIYHMIQDQAKARDCSAKVRKNICLEIYESARLVSVFSPNSPDLSLATRRIANNKELSKFFLQKAGIAVPQGRVFQSFEAARRYFRSRSLPQVVKPRTGTGGKGVTARIQDERLFQQAWAKAGGGVSNIIVEDFIEGDEVRVFVLNGKVTAAVCRVPAYVVGDGRSTIAQLVDKKNEDRKRNPLLKVYPIKSFDYLTQVLGKDLHYVPAVHEYVRLAMVSNVALGGESVGVLEFLHPSICQMAEQVWHAIPHATQLGLDIIARDFQAPAKDNAYVIEINADPAVATPAFSAYGQSFQDLPEQLIRYALENRHHASRFRGKPVLAPAAPYSPSCQGDSFVLNSAAIQTRLLRQAAYRRNLDVDMVDSSLTLIRDSAQQIAFVNGMCGLTRAATTQATTNKQWTKKLLSQAGLNTPCGRSFAIDAMDQAWEFASSLETPIVLKPLAGSGGAGISTDIQSRAHFEAAWAVIKDMRGKTVICEEQIKGKDYRLIVVGQRLCAVTERVPAFVIGDGRHSIEELVALKNQQRQQNPYLRSKLIALTPTVITYLEKSGLRRTAIPSKDQRVQLHEVANIGSGGEGHDLTAQVHPEWAEVAVRARMALYDAVHVGVDLLAEDMRKPPRKQQWAIIEINSNPEFGQHFIQHGQARDVAGLLIEQLFPVQKRVPISTQRIVLSGKVQGVGFRKWLWSLAHLHGVQGTVCNRADGTVEAVLSGPARSVAQLVDKCRIGPKAARVQSCEVFQEEAVDGLACFEILNESLAEAV